MNDEWHYRGYTMKQLDEMIGREKERGIAYVNISPADFDKIRTLVHEEIEKALMDEEDNYEPRTVVIDDKPKMHIEFEYDGVLYAGDAYLVEKKYE